MIDTSYSIFLARHPDLRPEDVIKDLWVNFGQSNKRVPIQKGMQTLATSTLYYS